MKRLWKKKEDVTFKETVKYYGPAVLLAVAGFFVAYQFVAPAPPRHIVIGTGAGDGAYYAFGRQYQQLIKENGIDLEVRQTAGSIENIHLLETDQNGVDVAFIQGGTGSAASRPESILSIGSLYYEPMWVFYRNDRSINLLSDLKGLRVAVGKEGSGTKALAMELLNLNGVTDQNTRIVSSGFQETFAGLTNGDLDVAIIVASHRAAILGQIIDTKRFKLLGLERPHAYAMRFHYLNVLTLPEGTIDFADNVPEKDLDLLAPTTQLAARADLHPALIGLLLQAAEQVHSPGGGFEKAGEFPAPRHLDFRLSPEARRFYKSGPPFLHRYLPFWVANFIARMTVMLLPIFVLLFPLFKMAPAIYRWRIRSKIYRWYSRLELVDPQIQGVENQAQFTALTEELDLIEKNVSRIRVPLAYSEELYDLRLHIDMLRNKLRHAQDN